MPLGIYFFLTAFSLLSLQVYLFNADIDSLSDLHGAIALFADFEAFVANRLAYICAPAIFFPLAFLLACGRQPAWRRRYLDILGWYLILRMAIQLIGLNILVFDSVTPKFLLITQLLFFLPYSLSVWG